MKTGIGQRALGNSTNVKVFSFALLALLLALGVLAQAEPAGKAPRIGYLAQRNSPTPATPDRGAEAFQQGLRELGYIEGKSITVEYRYGDGSEERLNSQIAELIQLKVKLIVTPGISVVRAVQNMTKTIPIVMVITTDPVAAGLVESLARAAISPDSPGSLPSSVANGWRYSKRPFLACPLSACCGTLRLQHFEATRSLRLNKSYSFGCST